MKQLLATFATLAALGTWSFAGPLDGVWVNVDVASQSVPKIEIDGTQFVWWGRTHPDDSKYGPLTITLLGDSVSDRSPDKYGYVTEDVKFADHVFTMRCVGEQLVVDFLTIFKDGSNRANYHKTLTFNRAP